MEILNYIAKKVSGKIVLILFLTSAFLGTLLVTSVFGKLILDPSLTMDPLHYYNSETFFKNLEILGNEGRSSYLILHLIDYLFITQFYLFFVCSLNVLLRKASSNKGINLLCLLPILSGFSDFMENLLIDISILLYPKTIVILGDIAGVFTFMKFSSLYLVFIFLFISLFVLLFKTVRSKVTAK